MKKVCVIGHFGIGEELLNGQTIKTKIVTTELECQLGADRVDKIDTHGSAKSYLKLPFQMLYALATCSNIIIFPAHNGVRVISPILSILNRLFGRCLHYVVIGGWLPELVRDNTFLARHLKRFNGIYVETDTMKKSLEEQGFQNIWVMPNCKELHILTSKELIYADHEPYALCTFSRVMKEKGIGDAAEVVKTVNEKYGRVVYTLDIFGQIDSEQIEWFDKLRKSFPSYIKYRGIVPFDKSTQTLKKYYALLFPTYYEGEGFAGTIIDAMAAGVPVIASDWRYNREIVIDNVTGCLFETKNMERLIRAIESLNSDRENWNRMKINCIELAHNYTVNNVIKVLLKNIVCIDELNK